VVVEVESGVGIIETETPSRGATGLWTDCFHPQNEIIGLVVVAVVGLVEGLWEDHTTRTREKNEAADPV